VIHGQGLNDRVHSLGELVHELARVLIADGDFVVWAGRLSQRSHVWARDASGLHAEGKHRCCDEWWVPVRATAFSEFEPASQLSSKRDRKTRAYAWWPFRYAACAGGRRSAV
jgi:hypothetical protein